MRFDANTTPRSLKAEVLPGPAHVIAESDRWSPDRCDPNVILFVGRFDRLKGADLVLDAFTRLHAENPALKLWFVGPDTGMEVSAERRQHWTEYVNEAVPEQTRERIRYFGALPPDQVAALRAQSYVTVVASRFETFPNTCIEALSYSCPLVATNVGGIGEIVRQNETGLLARPDDAGDLAAKISDLLDDRDKAAALGKAGQDLCRTAYNPDSVARRTIDFYRSIVN